MAIDKETIREDVKTLLGIEDSIQDRVLDILIRHAEAHLKNRLRRVNVEIREIPDDLAFIIEEVVVRRYNRLGSEGYQSESVEGHSVSFSDLSDEFTPYAALIEAYRPADDQGSGKVLFL